MDKLNGPHIFQKQIPEFPATPRFWQKKRRQAPATAATKAAGTAAMADDEVQAIVLDNGSGMCKAGETPHPRHRASFLVRA